MNNKVLFVWYIVIFGVLLYLKYQLIRPFIRLSELPMELAKGHLKSLKALALLPLAISPCVTIKPYYDCLAKTVPC